MHLIGLGEAREITETEESMARSQRWGRREGGKEEEEGEEEEG